MRDELGVPQGAGTVSADDACGGSIQCESMKVEV